MLSRSYVLALVCTFACSSSPSTTDGGTDASIDNVVVGGGDAANDVAPDAVSDAGSDAGPSSYTLTFPAQTVSGEQTLCITQRLGNATAIHAGSISSQLDTGDFQMLVYLSSATTEQTTPAACTPLGGMQDSSLQLVYIARAATDSVTFPTGVGLALAANQMVKIELHQFATQSVSAGAKVTFDVMSEGSFQNATGLFVQLAASLSISSDSTPHSFSFFNAIPSHMGAAKIFSMTGYENVTGIERKAWNAANPNDTSTQVYDSTDPFDAPKRTSFGAPLTFASGAGVAYQCTYNNSTGSTKSAGAARDNETCMFASYYYPSQGFELCYGTTCLP